MSLSAKFVLVAGGANSLGAGIVRAMLLADATVLVPSNSKEKLAHLEAATADITTGQLVSMLGDTATEDGIKDLQRRIYVITHDIDIFISALGEWAQGMPLTHTDMRLWERLIAENLTANVLAIKGFMPLVRPQRGIYAHLNGWMAEHPVPLAAPISMMAAAQKNMVIAMSEELAPTGIRAYELIVDGLSSIEAKQQGKGGDYYTTEEVGEYIIANLFLSNSDTVVHRLSRHEVL